MGPTEENGEKVPVPSATGRQGRLAGATVWSNPAVTFRKATRTQAIRYWARMVAPIAWWTTASM